VIFDRYVEIFSDFERLLQCGMEISRLLVGTKTVETHLSYADPIFTKLLCHAISLRTLSPTPKQGVGGELWDLPSACAIARCIIEAHDVLCYLVFNAISLEERELRTLIWKLHDKQRRLKMLEAIKSKDPRVEEIREDIKALLEKVTAHPTFSTLSNHHRKKILCDAPSFLVSQRELNQANSVNHDYHTSATMWLSQYVHTFPMALHQLFDFKAGTPDALRLSSMPIQYSSGFMAKAIVGMASVFPGANINVTADDAFLFSKWCDIVEQGVVSSTSQEE
jgi:hypothetical protein